MGKLKTLKPRVATHNTQRGRVFNPGSWRADRATAAQRGYGWKWQKAREEFLRKHPLCVECEARGHVVRASVVDHKVPHRGDPGLFWDETNWQPLCDPHHNEKTWQERREQ